MATNLITECQAGYNVGYNGVALNPYLFSSDAWLAFEAGKKITGMSGIHSCKKSRGHSVKIVTSGRSRIMVKFTFSGAFVVNIEVIREN